MSLEDLVVIVDLADDLQVRKQRIFKLLPRLGIVASQRREVTRGNQLVSTVTAEEARRIRAHIASSNGDAESGNQVGSLPTYVDDTGYFYLIQLEPSIDPGRYKVGFTTDLDGRLQKHRCAAPFAGYVAHWPCKRPWERAAIDSCTVGSEQLHTEVFRATDLSRIRTVLDQFFSLMPTLRVEQTDPESDARAS